jgi:hypothetical protein
MLCNRFRTAAKRLFLFSFRDPDRGARGMSLVKWNSLRDRSEIPRVAQNDKNFIARGLFRLCDLLAAPRRLVDRPRPQAEACATRGGVARTLISILLLLGFGGATARATTFFVSAAGSDSNSGTSSGSAWQTIAKVNGSTFSPGDSILFHRGDVWYGTALVVPSSGSSGSPITFGTYGSGANPIIKGATNLSTGGYTLAPNTQTTIFQRPSLGTSSTDSATMNFRQGIPVGEISNAAVEITISVTASPTLALNITGTGIGPAATLPNASAITRITWGGGNNGTTIAAGATATSDPIFYNLDNTVPQVVTLYSTSRNIAYYSNNGESLYELSGGGDQSQSATVSGYSFAGGNVILASIVATNVTAHTYFASLASAPVAVWENDTLLKLANNPLGVDQTAGSWFYDGTFLYLHASDGSNVATNGKLYDYVTSSSPTYNFWDNGKSFVVMDGVDTSEVYCTSTTLFACLGNIIITGSHNTIQNLSTHDAWRHNFCFYTGAANNTATNLTGYNSYGDSPVCIFGPGTTNNLLQESTFINDTYLREANVFTGDVWSLIVAHGGSTGNVVDRCVLESTAGPFRSNTNVAHGYGMLVGDANTTVTLSHSFLYGNFEWAVYLGQNGNAGEGPHGQIALLDNLIDCSQCHLSASGGGAYYAFGADSGSLIYNNTIYAPLVTNAAISLQSTTTGTLVKNNIVYAGGYATVDATSETGTAFDFNDYFSATGTPFNWGGTAFSFSGWQTASSQDAHSLSADPGLVNASPLSTTGNYSLLAVSPAIDAGVNLGATYQNALSPAASWPGGVSLLNQNLAGSGWEIGGYVYPANGNGSTLLLRGCCN